MSTDVTATKSSIRRYAATLAALKTVPSVALRAEAAADQFRAGWTAGTLTVAEVADVVYALTREVVDTHGVDSDETMRVSAAEHLAGYRNGFSRASSYLLDVPAEHRAVVCSEARLATNMTGGRYADHVQSIARNWERYVTAEAAATRARLAAL